MAGPVEFRHVVAPTAVVVSTVTTDARRIRSVVQRFISFKMHQPACGHTTAACAVDPERHARAVRPAHSTSADPDWSPSFKGDIELPRPNGAHRRHHGQQSGHGFLGKVPRVSRGSLRPAFYFGRRRTGRTNQKDTREAQSKHMQNMRRCNSFHHHELQFKPRNGGFSVKSGGVGRHEVNTL